MIDDLKALAIFAETVSEGSFRKAAKSLNLSPSVVSYHVSELEKRCGCALLYRSTRQLALTADGEQLYHQAQQMLAAAKLGFETINAKGKVPSGKLKIAIPPVLTYSPLIAKVSEFARQYPNIQLHISSTDERQNIIEEGIDVALRIGVMEDSNLKSKKIFDIARRLVCSQRYFSQKTKPKQPTDLTDWSWVSLAMLPNKRTLTNGKLKETIDYIPSTTVNNVEIMTELSKQGLGLATPPDYLVNDAIDSGDLIEVLPEWQTEPIPVYAIWPINLGPLSNGMRFIQFISGGPIHS